MAGCRPTLSKCALLPNTCSSQLLLQESPIAEHCGRGRGSERHPRGHPLLLSGLPAAPDLIPAHDQGVGKHFVIMFPSFALGVSRVQNCSQVCLCMRKHSPGTKELSRAVLTVFESGVIGFKYSIKMPNRKIDGFVIFLNICRKYLYDGLPMRAVLKASLAKVALEPLTALNFLTGAFYLQYRS